jgi:type II secretory pathway predicted ATPase ExeA
MYERYFGLKEKPFRITPDPRFLYLSEKHAEALDHLYYGITQGEGFMVISGDVGTGKTTVIRSLLERLDDPNIRTSIVLNPLLGIDDLLRAILEDFGLSPGEGSKKVLIDQLNAFLLDINLQGGKAVVFIDEAQNLSPDLLEELRSLSNLETFQEKLLQIVLVGQLELWTKLNSPNLRQLKQRISVNYRLDSLSLREMKSYIAHRLTIAGFRGDLQFSPHAYRFLFKVSRGIPRLINLLCDRTLLVLYLEQKMRVTATQVRKALESLRGGKPSLSFFRGEWLRRLALAGGGALLLFVGTLLLHGLPPKKQSVQDANLVATETFKSINAASLAYSVHISSFKKKKTAEQMVEKIRQEGLEAYEMEVHLPETGPWYRILIGQFENKEEALSLANRLRESGLFPFALVTAIPQEKTLIKALSRR